VVYRWAYDYSVPGADQDFLPQNLPPDRVSAAGRERRGLPGALAQPAE
jgi:cytochrome c oxidase subunit 1